MAYHVTLLNKRSLQYFDPLVQSSDLRRARRNVSSSGQPQASTILEPGVLVIAALVSGDTFAGQIPCRSTAAVALSLRLLVVPSGECRSYTQHPVSQCLALQSIVCLVCCYTGLAAFSLAVEPADLGTYLCSYILRPC